MKNRLILVIAIIAGCWGLLSVGLTLGNQLAAPTSSEVGWTTVFTETFTNTLSLWTFTETTSTGYQWGVVPYTWTQMNDIGLWAAGGGALGEAQPWKTGTYTNNMATIATVGPISLTENAAEIRITLDTFNKIDESDVFSIALSIDGVTFADVMTVSADIINWQHIEWSTYALYGAEQAWIIFSFMSDASGFHTGPLVDNITLEVRSGSKIYLPLIKQDPTPTPTLTPTPMPVYTDPFDDPNSGWFVGPAMRLNRRIINNEEVYVWEAVNWINYLNGHYQMYIPLTAHGGGEVDTWFVRTVEQAPMPSSMYPLPQNYCVEVSAYMAGDYDPAYLLAHWGVVFGGTNVKDAVGYDEVYTFQINSRGSFHLLRYHNYVYPGRREDPSFPGENIEIKLYDVGDEFEWGNPHIPVNNSHYYNTLKAAVRGNRIYPYINGQCVKDSGGNCISADITGMPRDRIGLLGASWEPTPVDIRFDYIRYDPHCPEVQ